MLRRPPGSPLWMRAPASWWTHGRTPWAKSRRRWPSTRTSSAPPGAGLRDKQVKDLEATIARAAEGGVEAVAIPARRLTWPVDQHSIPSTRVSYTMP